MQHACPPVSFAALLRRLLVSCPLFLSLRHVCLLPTNSLHRPTPHDSLPRHPNSVPRLCLGISSHVPFLVPSLQLVTLDHTSHSCLPKVSKILHPLVATMWSSSGAPPASPACRHRAADTRPDLHQHRRQARAHRGVPRRNLYP